MREAYERVLSKRINEIKVTICTNRLRELATVEHLKYRKYIKGEGSVGVNLCVCVKVKTSSRKLKRKFYSTNSNNNKNLAAGERLEIVSRQSRFLLKKKLFSNFSFVFFFCLFLKSRKIEQPSR